MDYESAIEFFDTLDDNGKAKEIYAHFGLAVYIAQVLEAQSINMIGICRLVKDKLKTRAQLNILWNNYDFGTRTFGVLINEIKQLYNLTEQDSSELKEVLKLRNYITHDYFRLNADLFYSDSGQKRMIKDFIEFRERGKLLDTKLINYTKVYTEKIGLTDEAVEKVFKESIVEWQKKIIRDDYKTIKK